MAIIKHLHSNLDIDSEYFEIIVDLLNKNGYLPLLYSMSEHISSKLKVPFESTNYFNLFYDNDVVEGGRQNVEVFIKEDDIYVMIYKDSSFEDHFNEFNFPPGFHLTIISKSEIEPLEKINRFKEEISHVILKSDSWFRVDGEENPNSINWDAIEVKPFTSFQKVDQIFENFIVPEYSKTDLAASELLIDKNLKEVLFLVKKAGAIRIEDIGNKFSDFTKKEINDITQRLSKYGLIQDKYLIQCRKNSQSLAEVNSIDDLEDKAVQNLLCATCGRKYKDEVIKEILSTTEKCNRLLKSSHWMTIFVTDRFIQGGIEQESIIWNIVDKSDEIDIAIDLDGSLFILELKDQNFEVGHAYPLNYRRVKFDASKLVVITTGVVSNEVKALFEDLYEKDDPEEYDFYFESSSSIVPIYIEGLENIDNGVKNIISNANQIEVDKVLHELRMISGVNFSELFYKFIK